MVKYSQAGTARSTVGWETVPRTIHLVLLDRAEALGVLPPFAVPLPWWPEVESVVGSARRNAGSAETAETAESAGIDLAVLRLLDATADPEDPSGMGGTAVYACQVGPAPLPAGVRARLGPVPPAWKAAALSEHVLRPPYARLDGPAALLAWATDALATTGRALTGPARQVKTWNLSALWVLPTAAGDVWMKAVPGFMAHEAAIIEAVAAAGWAAAVPRVLGHGPGVALLDHIHGEDQWAADVPTMAGFAALLVRIQVTTAGRAEAVLGPGGPDWRPAAWADDLERVVGAHPHGPALDALVAGLPDRWAAIDASGIPDSVVHGDFHPGNVRAGPDGSGPVILDWSDAGWGHPILDQPALLDRIDETVHGAGAAAAVAAGWAAEWRRAVPGCDPERAAKLLAPIAALRQAVVYQRFLDGIEPSERLYHERDVPERVARADALARAE